MSLMYSIQWPENTSIVCLCGKELLLSDLTYDKDFERTHPANRDISQQDVEHGLGHWTEFLKCPYCTRCIFADGKCILPRRRNFNSTQEER